MRSVALRIKNINCYDGGGGPAEKLFIGKVAQFLVNHKFHPSQEHDLRALRIYSAKDERSLLKQDICSFVLWSKFCWEEGARQCSEHFWEAPRGASKGNFRVPCRTCWAQQSHSPFLGTPVGVSGVVVEYVFLSLYFWFFKGCNYMPFPSLLT